MDKRKTQEVGVQFDALTLRRIERQAERRYGHIQGNVQSYIRNASMQQVQRDEKTETANQPEKETDNT